MKKIAEILSYVNYGIGMLVVCSIFFSCALILLAVIALPGVLILIISWPCYKLSFWRLSPRQAKALSEFSQCGAHIGMSGKREKAQIERFIFLKGRCAKLKIAWWRTWFIPRYDLF